MSPVRIHVCGTPRSGTTYLQVALVSHLDGSASVPETHEFFTFGVSEIPRKLLALARDRRSRRADQYDAMWAGMRVQAPDAGYLVEKTANHLRWLPQFLERDADVLAVIIEKPVAAASASLVKVPFGSQSIGAAYATVRFDRMVANSLRDRPSDRVQFVELGQLTADEHETLSTLLTHWGLPVSSNSVAKAASGERQAGAALARPEEVWKVDSFTPGNPGHVDRSLRALPADQRDRLVALEQLHVACERGSVRSVPSTIAVVTVLGRHAPAYLWQAMCMHAKHLLVRRMLRSLFLRPQRRSAATPS